ncbi:MAG: hypothetical protein JO062_08530 [Bryobacterales bacterium]|nr:hypothetical protein [Bryobacterales bacterium]
MNVLTAQTLIAECGPDMSRWGTEGHFVSWLNLAPNNKSVEAKSSDVTDAR